MWLSRVIGSVVAVKKSDESFHETQNQANSELAGLGIPLAQIEQILKYVICKSVRKIAPKIGVAFGGHRISWL